MSLNASRPKEELGVPTAIGKAGILANIVELLVTILRFRV
jgi:hypothetical protein